MDGRGLNQIPEMRPEMLLSATVESSRPDARSTRPDAGVDGGKTNFDERIKTTREQGRDRMAQGWVKIKEKMADLKKKIAALPDAIANTVINAAAEVLTVPARIEQAVDLLNQKIEDAKVAMDKKIAESRAKFERRRQALLRLAQETMNQIRESSSGFFGKLRESLFKSNRRKEQEDLVEMMVTFLKKSEQGGVPISPEQFQTAVDALAKIAERHRTNGTQITEFMKDFFTPRRSPTLVRVTT